MQGAPSAAYDPGGQDPPGIMSGRKRRNDLLAAASRRRRTGLHAGVKGAARFCAVAAPKEI